MTVDTGVIAGNSKILGRGETEINGKDNKISEEIS
jgi:hypothetical protein